MDNTTIELLLTELTDRFLESGGELLFDDPKKALLFWANNSWTLFSSQADPLSLLLVQQNPERVKDGDDDLITATLAFLLNKAPWWIRSFEDGWFGRSNRSMSITGFLLGNKLRRQYQVKE